MSNSPFQAEEKFDALLSNYLRNLRSIDDLQGHTKFQKQLRDICYRFNFGNFNEVYDPEDLYQDSYEKVRKSGHRLQIQGNVLDEQDFFKWLFVLVRNVFRSKDRQLNKLRRHGWWRCDEPVEELDEAAPDVNLEAKYFLSLFLDFIKSRPEEHQRVIEFWLSGCSLREMEKALDDDGIKLSYGSVRNEIKASLRAFKESLGLLTPEPRKKKARRR